MVYFNSLIIVLMLGSCTVASPQDAACCPEGHVVLRRVRSPHYCWEPKSNVTSFVKLTCNKTSFLLGDTTNFEVNSAAQLEIYIKNREIEFQPNTFCVGNITNIRDKNLTKIRRLALICNEAEARVISDNVFGYCMVVSSIFLLIAAFIYLALPELRDTLGKSLINFCLSLGIGLGILAAMKLVPYSNMDLCAARGFFAYYFIIASFFWANAISIQILRSIRRPTVNSYAWDEFLWYALYAWGLPTVLTVIMAVINFVPGDHLKPGIGLNHCWFFDQKQQWQYMYSVMTILLSANVCIFIYTSVHLWRQSFSSSHVKALRYKFVMTVRLFIVMGVAWVFEMVGTLVPSHIVWEILDLVNSIQGVLVFLVIVVFRRKVIKMMHRHGWLDCISGPVEKFLAVGEDEEDVVQHTIGLSMDDKDFKQ